MPHVGGLKKKKKRDSSSRTVCDGRDRRARQTTPSAVAQAHVFRRRLLENTNRPLEFVTHSGRRGRGFFRRLARCRGATPQTNCLRNPNSSANRARQSLGKCLGNQPPLIPHSPSAPSLAPLDDSLAGEQKRQRDGKVGPG